MNISTQNSPYFNLVIFTCESDKTRLSGPCENLLLLNWQCTRILWISSFQKRTHGTRNRKGPDFPSPCTFKYTSNISRRM